MAIVRIVRNGGGGGGGGDISQINDYKRLCGDRSMYEWLKWNGALANSEMAWYPLTPTNKSQMGVRFDNDGNHEAQRLLATILNMPDESTQIPAFNAWLASCVDERGLALLNHSEGENIIHQICRLGAEWQMRAILERFDQSKQTYLATKTSRYRSPISIVAKRKNDSGHAMLALVWRHTSAALRFVTLDDQKMVYERLGSKFWTIATGSFQEQVQAWINRGCIVRIYQQGQGQGGGGDVRFYFDGSQEDRLGYADIYSCLVPNVAQFDQTIDGKYRLPDNQHPVYTKYRTMEVQWPDPL